MIYEKNFEFSEIRKMVISIDTSDPDLANIHTSVGGLWMATVCITKDELIQLIASLNEAKELLES